MAIKTSSGRQGFFSFGIYKEEPKKIISPDFGRLAKEKSTSEAKERPAKGNWDASNFGEFP